VYCGGNYPWKSSPGCRKIPGWPGHLRGGSTVSLDPHCSLSLFHDVPPIMVKIVKVLQHGELCVCEIQEVLGTSQPTVSKHLKILVEAGLLNSRKDGLWVHYRLDDGSSSPYAAAILGNLKHWLEETPEIMEITKRLPDIRRANMCKT